MARSDIVEKLKEIIHMIMPDFDSNAVTLTEDANLVSDLGFSSVGVLYMVIAIEEFFNIRFDDVGFADFRTVGDVIDYIEKKV